MKTRILSYLLVFSMILALLPASALAEGESTTTQHVTATVKHAFDSSGAETGQITAQIEAYLTDTDDQSRTVKPCDIIFLIEQSTFMNTQNDTTQYGKEREDILNSMESLLKNLPTPTTGGEHRVAIAGFGRINNSGSSDSYIENQHPGARLTPDQNPSLNTGYYTCKNNTPVFHSQSGWTEWSSIPGYDEKTTLPEMPDNYLANEDYDDVFMSIDDAKNVIDVDKMVSWHAGASRMDAGLQITEQLAEIAKTNSKDRNLIIFVAASSLPYQNGVGVQNLRPEAAQAAAKELKETYNATIFGFGDFRALNLQNGMSSEEQRTQFNNTMVGICGNSNTLDGTPPSTVSLALSDDGTASFTPIVPSQEGYEFDGWYKNSACTDRYNESGENLTKNTFLYGRWTKIGTKKVTFTVVNGSWNTESDWYKNNIGNTDADTATDTITVNVPLRNGKGTLTPDLVPHVDNQDMTPADDYKAPGTWGDNAPDTNTDAITEDGDYEYTYTFPEADTYTITYRWVTGTEVPEGVSLPAQQTEKESNAGTNPTFMIKSVTSDDEKWSFSGWYTNEALTGTAISDSYTFPEGNANDTKNLTLYGKWTHDPCTVTFYADYFQPAQGHFNTGDYSISYTVPYGSTLAKEYNTVPTPVTELATCYFEGWGDDYKTSLLDTEEEQEDTKEEQEDTEGTEDTEDAEDTEDTEEPVTHVTHSDDSLSTAGTFYTSKAIQDMTIKSDLNFVAQWWPIVTFDANGGKWELEEGRPTERYVPVPANKNHIDSLRPPAREGYTFLGWYDTSGEPIDFKIRPFDGAETVYAHWAKNATVTFKIVNGYWSGNTTEDKTVTVVLHPQANGSASGTLGASHVPTIMIPAAGYENTPGHWDVTPNTEENGISGDVIYTYIFGKKHHSSSSDDENKDKDNNKENNKENNKDNNTGETTPTKVPDLLNGSNHFAYVVGYKDGNVRPQGNITRAETAAIFFRLLKEEVRSENLSKHNDFADVTEDSWYNTAVSTMAGMNILKGRTANSFVPQAPITRAEFAAICARFDSGKAEENNSFTDISGHWAEKEIERAATLGWVSGYTDGSFHPDAPITRAEAMTLINRVLCRMPETKADLLDSMTKWPDNQPGAWYYLAVQEATNSHTYEQKDSKYETWTALTAEPDWSKY